jgi:GNAT superfamily N-acetyltransferase
VTIDVRPATADRWDDVVAVMGTRGDPSRCWCQFFRLRGQDWRSATREINQEALRAQVCGEALPPGVLAYDGDDVVGWCAVAPKSAYPRILASRATGDRVDGVWSVICFVVRVGHRRKGVSLALLSGAVEFARAEGASVVEGYPVDTTARGSVSSAELYHGPLSLFEQSGFREVARPSPGRAVVLLEL